MPQIPDGRYVVRYSKDYPGDTFVGIELVIVLGDYAGTPIQLLIHGRKARQALRERSGLWFSWLAFEGNASASKLETVMLNSVAGQFMAVVEGGTVKRVIDVTLSERTFYSFIRLLSSSWQISEGPNAAQLNLKAVKRFLEAIGLLPHTGGFTPGEVALRNWLNSVTDPSAPNYYHEASVWLNAFYVRLGGTYDCSASDQTILLKNHGFERPPHRPLVSSASKEA